MGIETDRQIRTAGKAEGIVIWEEIQTMSAVKPRRMTEEEYLAAERKADLKSEYYNGLVVAMAGASWFHNITKDNLVSSLNNHLIPHGCRAISSDLKVWSPRNRSFTYPDIAVVCGKPEFKDDKTDIILN